MFNRMLAICSIISVAVLVAMLYFTTPAEIGPLGVLVFFVLLYVVFFGLAVGGVKIFYKLIRKRGRLERKDYIYGAIIAFGPIMMLLMQSFGSLNLLTTGLILLFVILGCFLVNKRV